MQGLSRKHPSVLNIARSNHAILMLVQLEENLLRVREQWRYRFAIRLLSQQRDIIERGNIV